MRVEGGGILVKVFVSWVQGEVSSIRVQYLTRSPSSPPRDLALACACTVRKEFKLPWREAGPPNDLDDEVDADQKVVHKLLARFLTLP